MKLDYGAYFTALAFLIPLLILATNWVLEYTGIKSNKRKREEANVRFERIVESLSSDSPSAQLSAAVLLRQFFSLKIGRKNYLHTETINVISSILRTLPTGIYQKTLADGLAYAVNLSNADLQRTNLQNIYLGSKSTQLILHHTDLFMANLSYGLIDDVDAQGIILYNALLYGTIIKNSDFSNANFVGADLTNVTFNNVLLYGADFSKATNLPSEIMETLKDGKCSTTKRISTSNTTTGKSIFFSMPGNMSKTDELLVRAYREYLTKLGYEVIYYNRDTYPRFGQLSQIKAAIEKCSGIIAFGTRQTFIKEGTYRPGMNGEKQISESWLSTPWNEVEVGMATMIGIPTMLIKDDSICDGIFDDVISESFIFTLPAKTDIKELDRNQTFTSWIAKLK